jgi:hypothetical protein
MKQKLPCFFIIMDQFSLNGKELCHKGKRKGEDEKKANQNCWLAFSPFKNPLPFATNSLHLPLP